MKENQDSPAWTGRRRRGDVLCFIEPRPERKYVVAGLLVSLLYHGAMVAKPVYDYWQQIKQWGGLLSIQIVDEPGAATGGLKADVMLLTQPLFYPPGLVKSKAEMAEEEERRRRREEARRRQEEAARRAREEQVEQAHQAGPASPQEETPQPSELDRNLQLLQEGAQRARTLNIGPIRDQIVRVYQAQQEGQIRIGEISVAVKFRIREDGAFINVKLVESSGIPEVDSAALIIVDQLDELRSLAPLQKTDSVVLRLSIGQDVEFRVTAMSSSEAIAAEQVQQLNGLLLAARFWAASKKQAQAAALLSTLQIVQEGVNVVASVRIPRAEASRLLKERIGSGS